MDSTSDSSSVAVLREHGDSTDSSPLSSCPPTPDMMDCDQSNNDARSSEPVTESPTQEYVLPSRQDGPKLDSNVSNQGYLGSEQTSQSPAQEHLSSRSREGQEASVAVAVHRLINHDDDQTAVSFPQRPTFHPANMVSEEYSYSSQSDGSEEESREQVPAAGHPRSEQQEFQRLNGSPGYSWRESNMAQTRDASARELSSVEDQRRAGAEVSYPWSHLQAGQPVLDQGPRENAPGTIFDTLPQGRNVLPPLEMTTLPLPEMPGPHQNQERRLPPIDNIKLPSIAKLGDCPQFNRWHHNYQWSGHLPNIYETRRLQQTADGAASLLIHGPTHLGPPLKPLDDARAEAVATEQWRLVDREKDAREAGGLKSCDCSRRTGQCCLR